MNTLQALSSAALARVGKMQATVSQGVCKAGAEANIKVISLIDRTDRKFGLGRGLSLASLVVVLLQIGIALSGLDGVPIGRDETANAAALNETP